MDKEGLVIDMGLLFPIKLKDSFPPLRYNPSRLRSCKPVSYPKSFEFQAHDWCSSPNNDIPAAFHTTTRSFNLLSGNHTIAGGNTPTLSSTCPLASYLYQCFDVNYSVTSFEGSKPSSIIPMQIANVLPQSEPNMHREASCVWGNHLICHHLTIIHLPHTTIQAFLKCKH